MTHSSNIQMSIFPLNFTSSRIWPQTTHIWFFLLTSIWWCWSWIIVAAATAMSMIATRTEGSNGSNWAGWCVTNQSKNTDKYLRAQNTKMFIITTALIYFHRFDSQINHWIWNKWLNLKTKNYFWSNMLFAPNSQTHLHFDDDVVCFASDNQLMIWWTQLRSFILNGNHIEIAKFYII